MLTILAAGGGPADLGPASRRAAANTSPWSPSPCASPASSMRCCAMAACSSPTRPVSPRRPAAAAAAREHVNHSTLS